MGKMPTYERFPSKICLGRKPKPTKLKTPPSVSWSEELEIETDLGNPDY